MRIEILGKGWSEDLLQLLQSIGAPGEIEPQGGDTKTIGGEGMMQAGSMGEEKASLFEYRSTEGAQCGQASFGSQPVLVECFASGPLVFQGSKVVIDESGESIGHRGHSQ